MATKAATKTAAKKRVVVKADLTTKTQTDGTGKNSGDQPKDGISPADALAQSQGIDPRAEGDGTTGLPPLGGSVDNSDELAEANKKPGEGGAPDVDTVRIRPRQRAEVMVKVKPTRSHVNITRNDGTVHSYPPGTTEMPRQDAEHWYAGAHGIEIDE